jgi:uncharacterized membrane protein
LRKILTAGLIAIFLIGIVYFFFRVLIVDVITPLFLPLTERMTDKDYVQVTLAIIFTVIVMFVLGALITRIKFQSLFNRYLRRVPKDLERGRGALVMLAPDTFFLALIIKEINFQRASGKMEKFYVLYGPSSPLPWSGLPILFVRRERVIPLTLSYGELYGITGSFGGTAPELMAELKNSGYIDDLAGEEGKTDSK